VHGIVRTETVGEEFGCGRSGTSGKGMGASLDLAYLSYLGCFLRNLPDASIWQAGARIEAELAQSLLGHAQNTFEAKQSLFYPPVCIYPR
jgi:hypothetical protein